MNLSHKVIKLKTEYTIIIRNLIIIVLFSLSYSYVKSQGFCHSVPNEANAKILTGLLNSRVSKTKADQSPMIRLALHRVVAEDGTGGNTWEDIRNVVAGLPDFYEPHNICFTVVSENVINNNVFFELNQFFGEDWENLIRTNTIDHAINIYFIADAENSAKATGFLFEDIPGQTIFDPTVTMSNLGESSEDKIFSSFNAATLAHEIGHCLGLWHTHGFFPNGLEEIPRTGPLANCQTAADQICDTPADPNLNYNERNVDTETCNYIGSRTLNGYDYEPDSRNVMSYTLVECIQHFTEGQGNRMRNFILNTNYFDDYVIPVDINIEGEVDGSAYYGTESTITSTANHINGMHVYEAGQQIRLIPGFRVKANDLNSFHGKIELYSCVEPLTNNSGRLVIAQNEVIELSVFPNPVNQTATLSYTLAKDDQISIHLFDTKDKQLKVLVKNKALLAGQYQIGLDVKDLPTGIFYLKLKSNENHVIKKLMVTK